MVRKNGLNQQVLMKKPDSIIETQQVPDEQAAQQPTEGFALANMFGAVPVAAAGGSGLKLNNLFQRNYLYRRSARGGCGDKGRWCLGAGLDG